MDILTLILIVVGILIMLAFISANAIIWILLGSILVASLISLGANLMVKAMSSAMILAPIIGAIVFVAFTMGLILVAYWP